MASLMAVSEEKFQQVRIVERKDHSPDLWSVRVRPEAPLPFQPGQYATLGVDYGSRRVERQYSIVSSPLEPELEFFVELVPQGGLSPLLHKLHVGDEFHVRRQAKGRFTLDVESGHKRHFLVATVTGVAPYMSMARTLARQAEAGNQPDAELFILQAASRSWEFAYRDELDGYAAKYGWIRYIPVVSRPWEDPGWQGEVGRAEDILRKYLDQFELDSTNASVYLCGHPQMIANAKGILRRRGFQKEFVREELYWLPSTRAT